MPCTQIKLTVYLFKFENLPIIVLPIFFFHYGVHIKFQCPVQTVADL